MAVGAVEPAGATGFLGCIDDRRAIEAGAGGVVVFAGAAGGGFVRAEWGPEPAGFLEGAAEQAVADGRGGGGAWLEGAEIEEAQQPVRHGGDHEVAEAGADLPGIGPTGAVAGGRGDDIAAIGFDIDAAAEAMVGAADVGAIGAAEEDVDAAAAGELAWGVGERPVEALEITERVIAAVARIDVDDE